MQANWKTHKPKCLVVTHSTHIDMVPGPSPGSSIPDQDWKNGKGLSLKVDKPFTYLQEKKWLYNRPETDTYKLLIDSFRMKLDDTYIIEQDNVNGSIYAGEPTSLPAFKSFLNKVEKAPGNLLPPW